MPVYNQNIEKHHHTDSKRHGKSKTDEGMAISKTKQKRKYLMKREKTRERKQRNK